MNRAPYRVLFVASHPVQYSSPIFRKMAEHPKLDILVAYCSLRGAEPELDPDFGVKFAWDVPLLDGYPWVAVPNKSKQTVFPGFWRLMNSGLWKMVRQGRFDAVVAYTGYRSASFWIATAAAKTQGIPLLFGTDAHALAPRDGQRWKIFLKKLYWPQLYRLADMVIVPSTGGVNLMRTLGIPAERIALTPYTVANDWWRQQSKFIDRAAVRRSWAIPETAPVVLFCAKLQPWKRPQDLLRAFAKAGVGEAFIVFAGAGPMKAALEAECRLLGIEDHVRFLGFVNQSSLPGIYTSADLLVLPSEYEPFGVVVNEAMLCGCPVVVSDQVGARFDLVQQNETGFVFPAGDIDALAGILKRILPHHEQIRAMGEKACAKMAQWSPEINIEATIQAIERAIEHKLGATRK